MKREISSATIDGFKKILNSSTIICRITLYISFDAFHMDPRPTPVQLGRSYPCVTSSTFIVSMMVSSIQNTVSTKCHRIN